MKNYLKLFSFLIFFGLLICPLAGSANIAESTHYNLIDAGTFSGGYSSSGNFQLNGAVGQISIGTSTDTSLDLKSGLLYYPSVTVPTVTAVAGDSQVALSWPAAVGTLGWTVGSYDVGWSAISGGPYNFISNGLSLSYTKTGLTNGIRYYFVVKIKDALGSAIATTTQVSAVPIEPDSPGGGGGSSGGGGCTRKGDLNNDCKVNLVDFSIAAYWYRRQLIGAIIATEKQKLSGDSKIDLTDFSLIAYYWTG